MNIIAYHPVRITFNRSAVSAVGTRSAVAGACDEYDLL